jgi:hypothetical protein
MRQSIGFVDIAEACPQRSGFAATRWRSFSE